MPRFRFPVKVPVNVAATAVALVVGATSATAAGRIVLANDSHPAATAETPPPGGTGGTEHGPTTSTTVKHRTTEPHPTTTTSAPATTSTTTGDRHEPPHPYPTTSTTRPPETHEPGSTTSTTRPPEHHEPTTSTTVKPTTSTTAPTTATTSPTSIETLTLQCRTGTVDGTPSGYCWWSKSTSPRFHHYRLTREIVGTPRQEIFTTTNHDTTVYLDKGLQPGANYSYIIEAYDADGHLIGRSQPVHFTCCDTTPPPST
ncbi:MAG TPA: hypothetical protein VFA83_08595 [Acidimicrobiales bacterium]|nr:hypothetical protein [Acidimicrobiales bacterium]